MPSHSDEREIKGLEKTEDALLHAQSETLRSLDVTNMLMVTATVLMAITSAFSAWTSWRVVQLTADFDSSSNRPYLGVASVKLDTSDPAHPKSTFELRNFGNLPAEQTAIGVSTQIDGQAITSPLGLQRIVLSLGVLSPSAPYNFNFAFSPQYLSLVKSGKAHLVVNVEATYRGGDGRLHCYENRYGYVAQFDKYDPDGGSSECSNGMPMYSPQTTWENVVRDATH